MEKLACLHIVYLILNNSCRDCGLIICERALNLSGGGEIQVTK